MFLPNAAITVMPDSDQSDGMQTIQLSNNDTGVINTIILNGITSARDAGLFNSGSINTVFGAGTVI